MSTPQVKKWKVGKRLSFMQKNCKTQIPISDDLRVEIMAVASCECGKADCSGVQARIMPLMWMFDEEEGEMSWIPIEPMIQCSHGIFTELVNAMWKVGKHLDGCKCTRCTRSEERWSNWEKNWKGVHRETGQFVETKVDHENWKKAVPYTDPTLEIPDTIEINYIPEEDETTEEELEMEIEFMDDEETE